ncbi:MAG TPA: Sir2 family NAD-dependent protein deacetylase, partial [Thermomicrobiales bacterium]|nr:Sir2 family NAD-dependent protein deacetylase [Thermomicrobiales bacterium]
MEPDALDSLVEQAASLIRGASAIAALTGAGISTESGIPDYRGPGGLWETRELPTISDYLENVETRKSHWQRRLQDYPGLATRVPNIGHEALVTLEERGILMAIITQNIDGLHQKAGNAAARVLELHGNAHILRCVTHGHIWSAEHIRARLLAG